jgi:hypothetical protein
MEFYQYFLLSLSIFSLQQVWIIALPLYDLAEVMFTESILVKGLQNWGNDNIKIEIEEVNIKPEIVLNNHTLLVKISH